MGTQTNLSDYILPPRAGFLTAITVSVAAGSQDLRLCGIQLFNSSNTANSKPGFQGKYITLFADGADVGVIFGQTLASVTGANAPVLATTGVDVAGVCWRIANGGKESYLIAAGYDVFIGFVGSAGGVLRIAASSP